MNRLLDHLKTFLIAAAAAGVLYTCVFVLLGEKLPRPAEESVSYWPTENFEESATALNVALETPADDTLSSDDAQQEITRQLETRPDLSFSEAVPPVDDNHDAPCIETEEEITLVLPPLEQTDEISEPAKSAETTAVDETLFPPAQIVLNQESSFVDFFDVDLVETESVKNIPNVDLVETENVKNIPNVDFFDVTIETESAQNVFEPFQTAEPITEPTARQYIIADDDEEPALLTDLVADGVTDQESVMTEEPPAVEEPIWIAAEDACEPSGPQTEPVFVEAENASDHQTGSETGNQIWLIDSATAQSHSSDPSRLRYWKLESPRFAASDWDQFLAQNNPKIATIILIHGNLTDMTTAVQHGMTVKNRLEQIQQSRGIETPFRLVIWKWASTKTFKGIRSDSQYKAQLADFGGLALAGLLSRLGSENNVTLVGFSFGARTAGSALELLAGGAIQGVALPASELADATASRYSTVTLAAAANCGDFGHGGKYNLGSGLLTYLLNVYNPTDKALKYYPLLYKGYRTTAMGVAPMNTAALPANLSGHAWSINSSIYGPEHRFNHLFAAVGDATWSKIIFNQE